MSATRAYLQVEGVNIYASILDTNQLSVVRGGSFMLREAIYDVVKTFDAELKPLSLGASSGLFRLREGCAKPPQRLKAKVAKHLAEHPNFRHLTFAVVTAECTSFAEAREELLARLRVEQLRSPSTAPDALPADGQRAAPCALEGRRIGTETESGLDKYATDEKKGSRYSNSAIRRWHYGRDRRENYYERETKGHLQLEDLSGKLQFTDDLQTLADCSEFPQLTDKLAVLYVDGNRFGDIQRHIATDEDKQEKFDNQIRDRRSAFLASLLRSLDASNPDSFPHARTAGGQLRVETLLWGGDEALFVAPTWHGFDLLHSYYQHATEWHREIDGIDTPLTHAAGLVFCKVKMPIAKIRQLAQQLAEDVKDPSDAAPVNSEQREARRKADLYNYLVLESIDYAPDQSVDQFRSLRYGPLANGFAPLKPAENWSDLRPRLTDLLDALPKSQIYRLARLATGARAESEVEEGEERLKLVLGEKEFGDCLGTLDAMFREAETPTGAALRRWVHLAELWDYLAPRPGAVEQDNVVQGGAST